MTKAQMLKMISQLSGIIDLLEGKWHRPQSGAEAAVLLTLTRMREMLRQAIESPGEA